MQDAISEKRRGGQPKFSPMRPFKVLTLLLYAENNYIERFGTGYTRIRVFGFATLYKMNKLRLRKDLEFLEARGLINNLTILNGKAIFQVEKPLWNEKSHYSNAIQDLQTRKSLSPM